MDTSWIIVFILILIIIIVCMKYKKNDVVYVKSHIDGQYYLVRELPDKQQASNLLATIKKNIMAISDYLHNSNTDSFRAYKPYIQQLHKRIKNVVVLESSTDNVYTSYSVNKGEQIVFCLRSRKINNKLHKINLLMYVVLHEMAHVACPEYNHTPLFKKIFAFLTTVAINIGLYKKIDFERNPAEYCGLIITDSIV